MNLLTDAEYVGSYIKPIKYCILLLLLLRLQRFPLFDQLIVSFTIFCELFDSGRIFALLIDQTAEVRIQCISFDFFVLVFCTNFGLRLTHAIDNRLKLLYELFSRMEIRHSAANRFRMK